MTKDTYFEMCAALNSEPLDSEIPVDFEDLPIVVQEAFGIYKNLQDNWDNMNGVYLGKVLAGIADIFDILDVDREDRKITLNLIGIIDGYRSELIASKKTNKKPPS